MAVLQPSFSLNKAIFTIQPDSDPGAVLIQNRFQEVFIQRFCADDNSVNTRIKKVSDLIGGSNAAAELDSAFDTLADRQKGTAIAGLPCFGAFQIDHVKP